MGINFTILPFLDVNPSKMHHCSLICNLAEIIPSYLDYSVPNAEFNN